MQIKIQKKSQRSRVSFCVLSQWQRRSLTSLILIACWLHDEACDFRFYKFSILRVWFSNYAHYFEISRAHTDAHCRTRLRACASTYDHRPPKAFLIDRQRSLLLFSRRRKKNWGRTDFDKHRDGTEPFTGFTCCSPHCKKRKRKCKQKTSANAQTNTRCRSLGVPQP